MTTRRSKGMAGPLPGQLDLFPPAPAADGASSKQVAPTTASPRQPIKAGPLTGKRRILAPKPCATASAPEPNSSANEPAQPAHPEPPRPLSRPRKRAEPKPGALCDVSAAAEHCGLSASTLNKLRCTGGGPKFVKITGAAVRYDPKDLDAWIQSRRRASTSEG